MHRLFASRLYTSKLCFEDRDSRGDSIMVSKEFTICLIWYPAGWNFQDFHQLPDGGWRWPHPHKSNPTHLNPKPCVLPRHVSKLLNFAAFLSGSAAADEAQKKVPKNTLQRKDKSVTWTGRCWWALNGRVRSKGMGWMGVWTWESDRIVIESGW